MSKLDASPPVSDDDDSFGKSLSESSRSPENKGTILISSDDDTMDYKPGNEYLTSDEEFDEADVKSHRNKIIEEKDKLISNLFPNSINATEKSEVTSQQKVPGHDKIIGGVKVNMPVPPYGCQIALMSKVITGIKKSENCLLESPTGTGKTLALLCAALAWQKHEHDRIARLQDQIPNPEVAEQRSELPSACTSGTAAYNCTTSKDIFTKPKFSDVNIYDKPQHRDHGQSTSDAKRSEPDGDKCCESLVTIHKRRKLNSESEERSTQEKTDESFITDEIEALVERCSVPTIYYGARTHKQLQQVIKEFKRTAYCGEAKMTILSSREYSCIRDFDRHLYPSKNDMCKACCAPQAQKSNTTQSKQATNCSYFDRREKLTHRALPPAFDLEELVASGRRAAACPYFAARNMAAVARLVFCPYNYLIDPAIRSSMQINVNNEIVILDEAHNIEDICRDAATYTFKKEDFLAAISELQHILNYEYSNQDIMDDVKYLSKALQNWVDWFNNQNTLLDNQPVNNREAVFKWQVEYFVQTLDNHNIGRKQHKEFAVSAENLCSKFRDIYARSKLMGVSQATATLVENIATVCSYLFREECKYLDDFKPALVRSTVDSYEPQTSELGWRSAKNEKVQKSSVSLRLLCMNPAVIFSGLSGARCVVLASGTLTPLLSLHSELGAAFPHRVSPPHVIPKDRLWVGSLTTCPGGDPLECQMRGTSKPSTQDALGQAVLQVCRVTPHGVLCFFPSYFLMNKLVQRWRETGLWRELNNTKYVFEESRNVKDHNEVMEAYFENVDTEKGALLLAVYRGKVSEGMDFKDDQARAVITVGIPYPNTTELMVSEKMLYNDRHTKDRNLLSSKEWLRVQAYRALNQAVGRCVRHRADWGAVLLVDARFLTHYYTQHLSGWVRDKLGDNHHTFESLVRSKGSLETFMRKMSISQHKELT